MKHTPGKWEVEKTKEGLLIIRSEEGFVPANINGDITSKEYGKQIKANARLIASSPIMYEYINKKAIEGDKEAKEIVNKINA
jgi:hypothetical protein